MLDPNEIKGYWWLPENPDRKFSGILSFSQSDGAYLDLLGVFEDTITQTFEEHKIILGISQQGTQITLYETFKTKASLAFTGFGGATFYVKFIFEGVHFEKVEQIEFSKLSGSYSDLDGWVDKFGFTIEDNISVDNYEVDVNYKRPDPYTFNIDDNYVVGITFSVSGPQWMIIQKEVKISQRTFLTVKHTEGSAPFVELLLRLNRLSYLHQLAIQRMNYPLEITGITESNVKILSGGKKYYQPVKIYFQPIEEHIERKEILPPEMLFTLNDLEDAQLGKWFSMFDRFEPILHLYRSLFYSNRLFVETRFLNIAQALEALHSGLFENQYLPSKEFKERQSRVLNAIPKDLQEWVKGALGSANYKRFKEKILELMINKQELMKDLVVDDEEFAGRVRDTRNEYVHNRKQKKTFEKGEELFSAIRILRFLFEAYILEMIGFSQDKILGIYKPRIALFLTRWQKF